MKLLKRVLQTATVLGAVGASLTMGVRDSRASLQLQVDYGNNGSFEVTAEDNVNIGTDDLSNILGVLLNIPPANGVIGFLSNTGLSRPILGIATDPEMDLHTVMITSGATDIRIQLTDTGFSGDPAGFAQLVSIGGSLSSGPDSYITANIYRDLDNNPFGTGAEDFICTTGPLTPSINFGFAGGCSQFMTLDGSYSITIETILHLTGSSIVSYDAYFGLGSGGHDVPEPASMMLLGFGVLGIGAWRRRRRAQQD
jgi:hypothetical protein